MQQITIRVPASTSNLGPGFDCLGVALCIHNEITVARTTFDVPKPLAIVKEAATLFFKSARLRSFPFSCSITGQIPRARGLGSSASVRVGILTGLNELSAKPLDQLSIFRLSAELEGHPDNVAPATFGGFTAVDENGVQRFEVSPRLHFVLLIPELEVKTTAARKVLPKKIARIDAVKNCAHACAITAAFVSKRYEDLRGAFADLLHQPFRAKLVPFLPGVIAAAEKAGALGAFLSGSGSTICAVTLKCPDEIAAAMQRVVKSVNTQTIVTAAENRGAQIRH
jgi:homoserine kinase